MPIFNWALCFQQGGFICLTLLKILGTNPYKVPSVGRKWFLLSHHPLPILLSFLLCRTFCPTCIFLVLFLVGLVLYNFKKSLTRPLSRSFLPVVFLKRFTISGSICKPFVHLQFNFCAKNEIKIQFHSSQCGYLVSPIPLRDAVISSVWIFGTLVEENVNTWIWHYLLTLFVLLFFLYLFLWQCQCWTIICHPICPQEEWSLLVPLIALLFHDPECLHTILEFFPMKILMAL